MDTTIIPPLLSQGDTIAFISPAGIARQENVIMAQRILQERGYKVVVSEHAFGQYGSKSGSVGERLSDLRAMWHEPEVKAIISTRGGYGAVELLSQLGDDNLASAPKWLVGFSDISVLHALLYYKGVCSVHGPMAKHISACGGESPELDALLSTLTTGHARIEAPYHPLNRIGTVEAPIIGGNLAVISALAATDYSVFRPGTILFLEDISEPIYRVERLLYELELNGVLGKLAGLALGSFINYQPDLNHPSMEWMIADMVKKYDFPVAFNLPCGHGDKCMPFIHGKRAKLSVTKENTIIIQ